MLQYLGTICHNASSVVIKKIKRYSCSLYWGLDSCSISALFLWQGCDGRNIVTRESVETMIYYLILKSQIYPISHPDSGVMLKYTIFAFSPFKETSVNTAVNHSSSSSLPQVSSSERRQHSKFNTHICLAKRSALADLPVHVPKKRRRSPSPSPAPAPAPAPPAAPASEQTNAAEWASSKWLMLNSLLQSVNHVDICIRMSPAHSSCGVSYKSTVYGRLLIIGHLSLSDHQSKSTRWNFLLEISIN